MRESMGGAWLFGIVALFIVLFSGFLAYSISYTKAFNTKNKILSYIEYDEGFVLMDPSKDIKTLSEEELANDTSTEGKAYYYIKKNGYNSSDVNCGENGKLMTGGYCVKANCNCNNNNNNVSCSYCTYTVTTYIKFVIPVVNVGFNLPVTGQTNNLFYVNSNAVNSIEDFSG